MSEAVTSVAPSSDQEARPREHSALLQRGEAALATGNVDAAQSAFERAAALAHSADSELSLIRTYMQRGQYRRALAFGAHTAGAHRDVAGGAALYAWLLHLGGQVTAALRVLDDADARLSRNPLLIAVREQLRSSAPLATGLLLDVPVRMAPYGSMSGIPASARVAGSGILIDGGRRALVPVSTLAGSRSVWVRNGLGALTPAVVEREWFPLRIAVLRLRSPLPAGELHVAAMDPFPGSIGFVVEYPAAPSARAGWPTLSGGFLGREDAHAGRLLGVELPAGPRGGPVFDSTGRLVGMAIPGSGSANRLLTASRLRGALGAAFFPTVLPSDGVRMPVDQIYESALRSTLQVILGR